MSTDTEEDVALSHSRGAYIKDEVDKLARTGLLGLGVRLLGLPASAASTLAAFWGLVNHEILAMRATGLKKVRDEYNDQTIQLLGQQVVGNWSDENSWKFVRNFGGTIWVQHVPVGSSGLSLVVFYHPSPQFQVNRRKAIRVYRGTNQCSIEDMYPQLRSR